MHGNAREPSSKTMNSPISLSPLQWDWDLEHADRALERKADAVSHGATPFQVDRRVLKDVVRENMDVEVGRINFLSSGVLHLFIIALFPIIIRTLGTFHKVGPLDCTMPQQMLTFHPTGLSHYSCRPF